MICQIFVKKNYSRFFGLLPSNITQYLIKIHTNSNQKYCMSLFFVKYSTIYLHIFYFLPQIFYSFLQIFNILSTQDVVLFFAVLLLYIVLVCKFNGKTQKIFCFWYTLVSNKYQKNIKNTINSSKKQRYYIFY